MGLHEDIFNMAKPSRRVSGYDRNGNWIELSVDDGETYDEYLKRTGYKPSPSISSQVMSGVIGGIAGYQMSKLSKEKKKQSEEEAKMYRQKAILEAQRKRLESDRELIKKRAKEQVRVSILRDYNYHEMMTHYFLGVDAKDRPFDIDKYGIPYYLDTESLSYLYYTKEDMDDLALTYSDSKRKRLGLKSIMDIPTSNWVFGETIDNSPSNMHNILAEETKIRENLEQYKSIVDAKSKMMDINLDKNNKDDDFEISL
jgi:hypothetical protein